MGIGVGTDEGLRDCWGNCRIFLRVLGVAGSGGFIGGVDLWESVGFRGL